MYDFILSRNILFLQANGSVYFSFLHCLSDKYFPRNLVLKFAFPNVPYGIPRGNYFSSVSHTHEFGCRVEFFSWHKPPSPISGIFINEDTEGVKKDPWILDFHKHLFVQNFLEYSHGKGNVETKSTFTDVQQSKKPGVKSSFPFSGCFCTQTQRCFLPRLLTPSRKQAAGSMYVLGQPACPALDSGAVAATSPFGATAYKVLPLLVDNCCLHPSLKVLRNQVS